MFSPVILADNIDIMDEVFELPLSEENNHVDDINDDLEIDLGTNHNDNIEKVEDILQENNVDEHLKQSGAVIVNRKTKARLKVEKDHNARVLQVILKEVKRPGKSEYFVREIGFIAYLLSSNAIKAPDLKILFLKLVLKYMHTM